MKTKHYSLPAESYLASRQSYVQRFTLIYSSFTLAFLRISPHKVSTRNQLCP